MPLVNARPAQQPSAAARISTSILTTVSSASCTQEEPSEYINAARLAEVEQDEAVHEPRGAIVEAELKQPAERQDEVERFGATYNKN
jgi:hypothetical protein